MLGTWVLRASLPLLVCASACRPQRAPPDSGEASAPASSAPAPPQTPTPSGRCISPRVGTVVASARPALRASSGVEAIELCRTRACDAPIRLNVDNDGRATPSSDLAAGTWFWRAAAQDASPPGPLWHFTVRRRAGLASRVHGVDVNGDGLGDAFIDAAVLFGAPSDRLASRFTPLPFAKLDAAPVAAGPAPMRYATVRLIDPAGDINGDGFDDALLDSRVVLGGAAGIQPESSWLACPPAGCGDAAGDVNGDGFADLFTKDALQLGSPTGLTTSPTTLLSDADRVSPAHDVDGDGVDDLVALSRDRSKISVLRGGARGLSLGSIASLTLPKDARVDLATADINGDGITDVVLLVAERDAGKGDRLRVSVSARVAGHAGDISHAEERHVSWLTDGAANDHGSATMDIADVDGDGFDDIVVLISDPPSGHVRVVHGGRKAMRLDPRRISFGAGSEDTSLTTILSIGDHDGDGRDDIVVAGQPSIGFIEVFGFFRGTSTGLAAKPSIEYVMLPGDRAPHMHE
jgi:FG-GAP-like repeat